MVARHLDVVTVQLQPDVDRVRILYDRYEGSPESVVSSNEEPRELRNRTRGNLVRHLLEQADRDELMPRTPGVAIDGRWLPPARVAPGFGKRHPSSASASSSEPRNHAWNRQSRLPWSCQFPASSAVLTNAGGRPQASAKLRAVSPTLLRCSSSGTGRPVKEASSPSGSSSSRSTAGNCFDRFTGTEALSTIPSSFG